MSDKQINKSVGMQILRKRTEKNYTRETLATLADVSPSFLYEIETGRKGFSVSVFYRIAKALDTDVEYFFYDDTDKKEERILQIIKNDNNTDINSVVELLNAIQTVMNS